MPPKEKTSSKKKKDKSEGGKEKKSKKKDKNESSGEKKSDKKKSDKKQKSDSDKDGKKKSKKDKKDKKGKNDKKKDVEELLEAPPDQGFFVNFLERYCCCRSAARIAFEEKQREERERKAAEEEARLAEEEKAKEITRGDIPIKELRKYIREFTKDYESKFWPPFFENEIEKRVRHAAATRIQTMVRAFLGPCRRRRREMTAYAKCDEFWTMKKAQKLHAKDLEKIAIATRASFSSSYARNKFNAIVSRKARSDAAFLIQRAWRGYVGRRIFEYFRMLARELRIKKPKKPKSRFSSEVFKRVWGRKNYEPKGGWPGKADFIEFDMWKHIDKPPKGNDYGLLTKKIRAAPHTDKELELLLKDKNAWVGIPTSVAPIEDVKKEPPLRVQAFLATAPYNTHVVKKTYSKIETPRRLSGMQLLHSLGWKNPLKDKEDTTKAHSHVVGLAGGKGSGLIPEKKSGNEPVNRHRIEVKKTEEVHPRHAAIKQVLKVPPDSDEAEAIGLGTIRSVDLNSKVFQASDSFVPYYPGKSGTHFSSAGNINNSSSFDESFVNQELNNMSSFKDIKDDCNDHLGISLHHLGGVSSASVTRQDKMKPDGPRLSTLRHDEIVPVERGARKAPMGRALRVGSGTQDIALGNRSVSQIARETERSLLHMNHHEQLHRPKSSRDGPSGTLNKSVSFLTIPDQSNCETVRNYQPSPLLSATNSENPAAGSTEEKTGETAWKKLRDDVSSLTGTQKKFLRNVDSTIQSKKKTAKFSAEQRKKNLENRERPWPIAPSRQLHMKYTWISQTMLRKAANDIHSSNPKIEEEEARRREEREREEKERRKNPLSRLSQYNDDDPTVISNLTELQKFQRKTYLSIRDERCRAQALQHPYHWL